MKKFILLTTLFYFFSIALVGADTHVVIIGDSHTTGEFGQTLVRKLREKENVSFDLVASGASASLQWINNAFTTSCGYTDSSENANPPSRYCVGNFMTPTLLSLLVKVNNNDAHAGKEKVAVVALGSNMGSVPRDYQTDLNATKSLLFAIQNQGFKCVWIGPPNMPRFQHLLEGKYGLLIRAIKESKVACRLIDSRLYTTYPAKSSNRETPDGIHYDFPATWWYFPAGTEEANSWAVRLFPLIFPESF